MEECRNKGFGCGPESGDGFGSALKSRDAFGNEIGNQPDAFGNGPENKDAFGNQLGNQPENEGAFGSGFEDGSEVRFGGLFDAMEPEDPPCGFDRRVMSLIDKQQEKRSLRRQWFYMISLPGLGIAAMIGSLYLITRYMGVDIRIPIPRLTFPRIEIDPAAFNVYMVPAICALLLLIADTLIRKRIEKNDKRKLRE